MKALNAEQSKGVNPANNGAIPLLKAIGVDALSDSDRVAFFAALRVDENSLSGPEVTTLQDYIDGLDLSDFEKESLRDIELAPYTSETLPNHAAWVESNDELLSNAITGLANEYFYIPIFPNERELIELVSAGLTNRCVQIGRGLAWRSMLRLGKHDINGALEDIESLYRLGRHLSQHAFAFSYALSGSLETLANRATEQVLISKEMSIDQCNLLRRMLESLPSFRDPAEAADREMRIGVHDFFFAAIDNRTDSNATNRFNGQWLDINVALRTQNEFIDKVVDALKTSDRVTRDEHFVELEWKLVDGDIHVRPELLPSMLLIDSRSKASERLALSILRLGIFSYETYAELDDTQKTNKDLLNVGVALAAYHTVHGEYPQELDALNNAGFPVTTIDRFSGEQFRYRLTEGSFLLYSVGPDEVDNGGVRERKLDITLGENVVLESDW